MERSRGVGPGLYVLDDGMLGYGAGLGQIDSAVPCLILSVEKDDAGRVWAHIVRLSLSERLPAERVVYVRQHCALEASTT